MRGHVPRLVSWFERWRLDPKSAYDSQFAGGWIMGTPAEFRRNARECVELAGNTANAVHRNTLLGLAVQWFQLAGVTQDEMKLTADNGKQSVARRASPIRP
jgi:hypothetical protein